LAIIHNGVIENSQELKEELLKKGIKFKSETDTEVVVQQIGYFMDEGLSCLESFQKTLQLLRLIIFNKRGTWGFCLVIIIFKKDK
jgi:glucosamine--fructose-6-phosphate aminotransferase (isomerizing)